MSHKKDLADLFKKLSIRIDEKKVLTEGLQQSKKLKKRISNKKGLVAVNKRLRKGNKPNLYLLFLKKHKGKPINVIRTLWKAEKNKQ